LVTKTAKYRVTYRRFNEYVDTGTHLTNVHYVLECDVVALDATDAIAKASVAFMPLAHWSGDWKVRMLRAPQEVEFVGSQPDRSTIVNLTKMGT
jgi:hypothetical protein